MLYHWVLLGCFKFAYSLKIRFYLNLTAMLLTNINPGFRMHRWLLAQWHSGTDDCLHSGWLVSKASSWCWCLLVQSKAEWRQSRALTDMAELLQLEFVSSTSRSKDVHAGPLFNLICEKWQHLINHLCQIQQVCHKWQLCCMKSGLKWSKPAQYQNETI